MEKQLYCVYFESANYAGHGDYCLVMAESESDAMDNTDVLSYAEDMCREQHEDQYTEEYGEDEAENNLWASIISAELVEGSDVEQYIADPSQANFYPMIG